MKKFLALLIALAMVFALCACGEQAAAPAASGSSDAAPAPAQSSGGDSAPAAESWPSGRTIGMNLFVAGTPTFEIFATLARVYLDQTGDTLETFNDQQDINQVLADAETMVNFGCDGVLWWGVMDPFFQVGCPTYNDAGVYFAFNDCAPMGPELRAEIQDMEYFAGSCSCDNTLLGKQMGEAAVADGCKVALIFANEIGSTVVDRANGFQEVFEAAGGKVVEVSHVSAAGGEHIEATRNFLAAYPDIDCIYGVSVDYITGASTVTAGKDIKLYGTDVNAEVLPRLLDGTFAGLNGGHWCSAYVSSALLINAMDGHPIYGADGKGLYLYSPSVVVTPENAEYYEKYFINDVPYHYEDVAHLLYRNNPNVTYKDFEDFLAGYSVENVVALHEG